MASSCFHIHSLEITAYATYEKLKHGGQCMSNTIIRATRRDRYVTIEQHAIEDARLSWAARGLLAYLLSNRMTGKCWLMIFASVVILAGMVSTSYSKNYVKLAICDLYDRVISTAVYAVAPISFMKSRLHHIRICRMRLNQIWLHPVRRTREHYLLLI